MKKEILAGLSALLSYSCANTLPVVNNDANNDAVTVCEIVEHSTFCPEGGNLMLTDIEIEGNQFRIVGYDHNCDGRPEEGVVYPLVRARLSDEVIAPAMILLQVGTWNDYNLNGLVERNEIQMNSEEENSQRIVRG